MGNLVFLLQSRKFWISVIGLIGVVYVSVTGRPELPEADLVNAIVTIVTVLVGSIALEDGLTKR